MQFLIITILTVVLAHGINEPVSLKRPLIKSGARSILDAGMRKYIELWEYIETMETADLDGLIQILKKQFLI